MAKTTSLIESCKNMEIDIEKDFKKIEFIAETYIYTKGNEKLEKAWIKLATFITTRIMKYMRIDRNSLPFLYIYKTNFYCKFPLIYEIMLEKLEYIILKNKNEQIKIIKDFSNLLRKGIIEKNKILDENIKRDFDDFYENLEEKRQRVLCYNEMIVNESELMEINSEYEEYMKNFVKELGLKWNKDFGLNLTAKDLNNFKFHKETEVVLNKAKNLYWEDIYD